MLFLIGGILLFILRILIVKDNLDYLHGIVSNLFDSSLGAVNGFFPSVLFFLYLRVSELEFILFGVVVKIFQETFAAFQ